MQRLSKFNFSTTSWYNNVTIFGYKMRLEKLNFKKQIGVKVLESYRSYKLLNKEMSQFKLLNWKTLIIRSLIGIEIGSFLYFKVLEHKTSNEFLNSLYNHEKKSDYVINFAIFKFLGQPLVLLNPFKANALLLFSALGITSGLEIISNKLESYMSTNLDIVNFKLLNENNILPKIVLASALVKFLSYFITTKIWRWKFLTFNRQHIFVLLSIFLLMKTSSFVSLFTSDNIK